MPSCLAGLSALAHAALIVLLSLPAAASQCMVEDTLTQAGHAKFMHTACRCPYYRTAEHGLYGTLTLGDTDNQGIYFDSYWSSLTTTTLTTSSPDQCGINLPGYPDKFKSAFMADPDNPTCGEYLQFTSQYPGKGPCYPVLVPTVEHLNRCHSLSIVFHTLLPRLCLLLLFSPSGCCQVCSQACRMIATGFVTSTEHVPVHSGNPGLHNTTQAAQHAAAPEFATSMQLACAFSLHRWRPDLRDCLHRCAMLQHCSEIPCLQQSIRLTVVMVGDLPGASQPLMQLC